MARRSSRESRGNVTTNQLPEAEVALTLGAAAAWIAWLLSHASLLKYSVQPVPWHKPREMLRYSEARCRKGHR